MDYLDQTIEVWQPYTERPLTREDAREIAHNVMGFFEVLRQWADEEKGATAMPKQIAPTPSNRGGKAEADGLSLPDIKQSRRKPATRDKSGR